MKKELSRYLDSLTKAQLKAEIIKLSSTFKLVKEYYEMELLEDSSKILEKYKTLIRNEYFPKRGFGKARSSVARKVISDFKKIAAHQKDVIDLVLYRVENMIDFSCEYGDVDVVFYDTLAGSFQEACQLICKEKLESHYDAACSALIDKTISFGYGVTSELDDIYSEHF